MYGEKSKFKGMKTLEKGTGSCITVYNFNNSFLTRKFQKTCLKSGYNEEILQKVNKNKGGV